MDYSIATKPTNEIIPYPTTPTISNLEAAPCKPGVTDGPVFCVGSIAGTTVYAVTVLTLPSAPVVVYVVALVVEVCVSFPPAVGAGVVVGLLFVGVLPGGVVVGEVGDSGVVVGGGLSVELSVGSGVSDVAEVGGGVSEVVVYRQYG